MRSRSARLLIPLALLLGVVVLPAGAQTTDQRVANTADPTVASVQISQAFFAQQQLDAVVVARNDVFPDNLGGAGLAGTVNGVLLLTDGGPTAALRPEIRTEVSRVLRPQPGRACAQNDVTAQVFILGGTNAVSTQVEQTLRTDGWCVNRLSGGSRVETALAIANVIKSRAGQSEVLIARSDNFADAATGGAYAGRFDRPIVVTGSQTLHPAVNAELFGAAPFYSSILMLGGTAALSQGIENAVRNGAANPASGGAGANPTTVARLSGPSRDSTATAIADQYVSESTGTRVDTVALVNGFTDDAWVYALAGGAVSWQEDLVVLYVDVNRIPDSTCAFIAANNPSRIFTVGPTARISDATTTLARDVASGSAACSGAGPVTPPAGQPTPTPTPTTPPAGPTVPAPDPNGQVILDQAFTIPPGAGAIETHLEGSFIRDDLRIELFSLSNVDPTLELLDPRAAGVAFDDDSGGNLDSLIDFVIPESGEYEVVMRDLRDQGGAVHLRITLFPPIPAVLLDEAVTPPGCGAVTRQVSLNAGDDIIIEAIDAQQNGSDPRILDVLDPFGNSVTSNDDGGFDLNSEAQFFAPSTGNYLIDIDDLRCTNQPIRLVTTRL